MRDGAVPAAGVDERDAIARLLVRYARSIDDGDVATAGLCFAEDAQAEYGGRSLEPGRAGIVDYLRARTAALRASTHFMGNMSIDVEGAGAHAVTDGVAFLVFRPAAGDAAVIRVRGLRYDDVLTRGADGWQITRRTHQARWMFDVPSVDPAAHRPDAGS